MIYSVGTESSSKRPLKTNVNLSYVSRFSSCRTVNTLLIICKNQSVKVVYFTAICHSELTNLCLFSEPYGTSFILCGRNVEFLSVKPDCIYSNHWAWTGYCVSYQVNWEMSCWRSGICRSYNHHSELLTCSARLRLLNLEFRWVVLKTSFPVSQKTLEFITLTNLFFREIMFV